MDLPLTICVLLSAGFLGAQALNITIHNAIIKKECESVKEKYPNAKLLMHPEIPLYSQKQTPSYQARPSWA